jgi:hypothetical protein
MHDGMNAALPGHGDEGHEIPAFFSLPTPCAMLDRAGRVARCNGEWSARQGVVSTLIPVGENFVEAVRAVSRGGHAAAGLEGVLAGGQAEYGCDLCVDEAAGVWIRLLAARDPAGSGSGGGGWGRDRCW